MAHNCFSAIACTVARTAARSVYVHASRALRANTHAGHRCAHLARACCQRWDTVRSSWAWTFSHSTCSAFHELDLHVGCGGKFQGRFAILHRFRMKVRNCFGARNRLIFYWIKCCSIFWSSVLWTKSIFSYMFVRNEDIIIVSFSFRYN